ncbi:acyltransferase, partial [Escherichia coli]|nr:acyltransferase [Escherichia coli]
MKFRKDINGLRAVAVMAVVLYHFGISGFGGGFVGVDVFFVISGFLMTGIIVKRISENKFSLIGFYLDRTRRIVPALCALCAVLIVVCWFFLIPVDFETLGKHVSSSVTFLSNIVYYNEINYFDASAKEKWLLHTWSLSVEWQFYIIYPIIILALSKSLSISSVKKILILLLFASFASSVYLSNINQASSFYLLHSRAWEMLAGGLVYLYPLKLSSRQSYAIKYIGIIGVFSCILLMSSLMVWP